jgi:hypothetical protein
VGRLFEDRAIEAAHAGTICESGTDRGVELMLSLYARIVLVLLLAVTMAGCAAVAGIFKAGFWVGIVIAVIIVGGLMALLGRRG